MKKASNIIYEGVLNDDMIEKTEDGSYTITYYTFRNAWANDKHEITSKDLESLLAEYDKETGRLNEIQGEQLNCMATKELAEDIDYIEMEEA